MAKSKLTDLEREEFLTEVKENWPKWRDPTRLKDLIAYMRDHAFTKKAEKTLNSLSKDQLREIIINGDEETSAEATNSKAQGFGTDIVSFLEEFKIELHKKALNPFVKRQVIKQIDKQASKIEDESIFEKLGWFGLGFMAVLFVLDMALPNGYKDTLKKFKEFRAKKKAKEDQNTLEAEIVQK